MVECELTFAGLIVMQNRLKPETSPVIQTLIKANIRPVMITGERESGEKEGEEGKRRERREKEREKGEGEEGGKGEGVREGEGEIDL